MSRIAHYVILACPPCAQKHVRAEFASVSDPVFSHALDPPSRERVCRGCGKSVTNLAIVGLLPKPAGRVEGGSVRLEGRELTTLKEEELRQVRGSEIAMIFQDPMTSLNPVLRIEEQLVETIRAHRDTTKEAARARAVELLAAVGVANPESRLRSYPHEFSGGMRQRVMIAMALALEPRVLIADEPTTALDVTIQAQVLDLLRRLTEERGTATILVTHDLGVLAGMADRVNVMYAGTVIESGTTDELFAKIGRAHV